MKKLFTIFCIFFLLSLAILSNAQQVVISDDGSTSAASGAMLEVKSSTKGFLAPQIELPATDVASPVTLPATGLMVFNTATDGDSLKNVTPGYYYNAGTPEAPNWAKVMKEDFANGMTFQIDGSPILNGTATNYTDLVVNPATARNSGNNVPEWSDFVTNIPTYLFDKSASEAIAFQVQLPHSYKEGSDIYPHVHWAPMNAAGITRATWVLVYQWENLNSNFETASSEKSGYLVVGDVTTPSTSLIAKQHTITTLGTISGSGKHISSILMCRLYRFGLDTHDDLDADAAILSIDFHYQIDTFGSREEFVK